MTKKPATVPGRGEEPYLSTDDPVAEIKDRGAADTESIAANEAAAARIAAQMSGEEAPGWKHADEGLKYNSTLDAFSRTNETKIYLTRVKPSEHHFGQLPTMEVDDWGALIAYVSNKLWDGREATFQWSIKNKGQNRATGKFTLADDAMAQAEYARRVAEIRRSAEASGQVGTPPMAAAPASAPGGPPPGYGWGPPPPGYGWGPQPAAPLPPHAVAGLPEEVRAAMQRQEERNQRLEQEVRELRQRQGQGQVGSLPAFAGAPPPAPRPVAATLPVPSSPPAGQPGAPFPALQPVQNPITGQWEYPVLPSQIAALREQGLIPPAQPMLGALQPPAPAATAPAAAAPPPSPAPPTTAPPPIPGMVWDGQRWYYDPIVAQRLQAQMSQQAPAPQAQQQAQTVAGPPGMPNWLDPVAMERYAKQVKDYQQGMIKVATMFGAITPEQAAVLQPATTQPAQGSGQVGTPPAEENKDPLADSFIKVGPALFRKDKHGRPDLDLSAADALFNIEPLGEGLKWLMAQKHENDRKKNELEAEQLRLHQQRLEQEERELALQRQRAEVAMLQQQALNGLPQPSTPVNGYTAPAPASLPEPSTPAGSNGAAPVGSSVSLFD